MVNIAAVLDDVMFMHSGYIYFFNNDSYYLFNCKTKVVKTGWPEQPNIPRDIAAGWFNCGSKGTKTSVIKVLKLTGD